jgi:hypothetical protein
MKRREFTFLLASTIALRPNLLQAQQGGRIFKIDTSNLALHRTVPTFSEHSGIGFVNWATWKVKIFLLNGAMRKVRKNVFPSLPQNL